MSQKRSAHQILTELEETGELKTLIRSGFCQPCIIRDLNIYRSVNAQVQTGSNITRAIVCASSDFELSERSIYSILKNFK